MDINNVINQKNFPITCPKCKKQFSFMGGQVGTTVICPNCKVPIHLNDNGFSSEINDINKTLDAFKKDLKKMFK